MLQSFRKDSLLIMLGACCALGMVFLLRLSRPGGGGAGPEAEHTRTEHGRLGIHSGRHGHEATPQREDERLSSKEKPSHPLSDEAQAAPEDRLLTFRSAEDAARFADAVEQGGGTVLGRINALNALRVRMRDGDLRDLLAGFDGAVRSETNYVVYVPSVPSDRATTSGSYVGFGSSALAWLGVRGDNTSWGKGTRVAVIDTGVLEHSSLEGVNVQCIDLLGDTSASADSQYVGHGTAIASIIAGQTQELPGMAPSAAILSIRALGADGYGDVFTVAQAIVTAVDQGAQIVNLSLGTSQDSGVLRDAVAYALDNGVAVVAAAGNSGESELLYPAAYDGVAAVTGVDTNGQHVDFANTGSGVDIAAPATGVSAAWTDNSAVAFSGTSIAAAFVTGATAAALSENEQSTPAGAVQTLLDNADDTGAPNSDETYGEGILNVARTMQEGDAGIVDAASMGVYLPSEEIRGDTVTYIVSAENRGTEPVLRMDMIVDADGVRQTAAFTRIEPGQTVSREFTLSTARLAAAGSIEIQTQVVVQDAVDVNPRNDVQTAVIHHIASE